PSGTWRNSAAPTPGSAALAGNRRSRHSRSTSRAGSQHHETATITYTDDRTLPWVQQLPREVLASLRRSLISWKAVVCAGSFGVRRADGCRQDSQYWWIVLHNARRWTLTVRETPWITGGAGC